MPRMILVRIPVVVITVTMSIIIASRGASRGFEGWRARRQQQLYCKKISGGTEDKKDVCKHAIRNKKLSNTTIAVCTPTCMNSDSNVCVAVTFS